MSGTTQSNTNAASMNSYLPPVWESTFMMYLVLPGLCAFFLFLLIFLVAFRLIKTRKPTPTDNSTSHFGSYIEQSTDTCIYEVICESQRTSMIQNGFENEHKNLNPHNLRVCLPELQDPQGSKSTHVMAASTGKHTRPLHPSKGQGYKSQYYDISGLVNYLEKGTFPTADVYDNCCNSDAPREILNSLHDEHPIYESLGKEWKKTCLDYEHLAKTELNCSSDSVCHGFSNPDNLERCEDQHVNRTTVTNVSNNSRDSDICAPAGNPNSGFETSAVSNQRCVEYDVFDIFKDEDNDDDDDLFHSETSHAICKLSIAFDSRGNKDDVSKQTVRHYYYKINHDSNNSCGLPQGDYQIWENKLNSSHIFLMSESQCDIGVEHNKLQDNPDRQNGPFKLELVSISCTSTNIPTSSNGKCANKMYPMNSGSKKADSCETLSRKAPCNYQPRRKQGIKKSQSFKESNKYKRAERGRKFSLGALTINSHNKIYNKVEHHHMSIEQLEVERILARLGPLPPTPTPETPPPLPSSPPPSLPLPSSLSSSHLSSLPSTQQIQYSSKKNIEDRSKCLEEASLSCSRPTDSMAGTSNLPSCIKEGENNSDPSVKVRDTSEVDILCTPIQSKVKSDVENRDVHSDEQAGNSITIIENRGNGETNITHLGRGLDGNQISHYFILENERHSCLSDDTEPDEEMNMSRKQ